MEFLKVDLHLHSGEDHVDVLPYSAFQLINRCAELRYEVICIANHKVLTYSDTWRQYAEERGILLLPAVEAKIEGRHVLILNANNEANRLRTFADLKAYRESRNVFIIAPHPFYPAVVCLREKLYEHADIFDAVEFHSFYTDFYNPNRKAQKFALETGKPLIANSDCHQLNQLGNTYSLLYAEPTIDSVLQSLRKGDVQVVSKPLSAESAFNIMINLRIGDVKRIFRQLNRKFRMHAEPVANKSDSDPVLQSKPVRSHQ